VGKAKRRERRDLVTTAEGGLAARHDLHAGILGHDPWTGGQDVGESLALGVDAVFACVTLLADAVSSAEWGEWRGTLQLPPSRIVRRPMASLTRREWTWLVTSTLALYSACPIRLAGGLDSEGVPMSLVPLAPSRVSRQGNRWWVDGQETDDEIRVIRRVLFPSTDARMSAVLHLARETFAAAAAAQEYLGDWWVAGGSPLVQIVTDQELTDPQAASIGDRYVNRRKLGPGTAPVVLGKGAKLEPVGADAATDGAMTAQDHLAASVARYFRVPPHLVNVPNLSSSLTYGTTESASTDLVRYTLDAYAAPIGDLVSEVLPGDYLAGRQVRLDLRHLTRAEFESRTRGYESAIRAGWLAVPEVREFEGLPPQEGVAPADNLAPAELPPLPQEVPTP
jgi:HK97 family phage portal protein